ncbi:MAG: ribonuclease III [Lachnospiraceae bacterium]
MLKGYTLDELENRIGYHFKDKTLLKQAVTHSSFTNEQKINKQKHYERLEFLGDAVLELVTSDFLFHEHPEKPEGQLTKMRASMVCEPALAFCARDLELGKFMLLGKGEEATGGRNRDSITSDVMEAVIGAIFLDGGMEEAKAYIYRFVLSDLDNKQLFFDSKTNLQEYIQGHLKKEFHYELIEESGPEHDKLFVVEVIMEGKVLGTGHGRTKKAAEQQAAYEALLGLRKTGRKGKDTCI